MTEKTKKDARPQPASADAFARGNAERKVLEPLRLALVLRKYRPGERLIETRLAEEYGVSRASLRVALQTLENEGLIRKLPNGGKEVLGFSRKDAMDVYDLRWLLEKRALEIIAARPQIFYAPLLDVLGHIERSLAPERRRKCNWHLVDIRFHKAVMQMADNGPLLKSWDSNSPLIYSLMTLNTSADYRDRYIDEFYEKHKVIFDHLVTRNSDVFGIMRGHIDDAKTISSALFDKIEAKAVVKE